MCKLMQELYKKLPDRSMALSTTVLWVDLIDICQAHRKHTSPTMAQYLKYDICLFIMLGSIFFTNP